MIDKQQMDDHGETDCPWTQATHSQNHEYKLANFNIFHRPLSIQSIQIVFKQSTPISSGDLSDTIPCSGVEDISGNWV